MKKILLIIPVFLSFACNNKKDSPVIFSPDILAQQVFSIDAGKDTSLQTLHGSIIKIMAGTFNVKGVIQVEIKEAFTAAEIFAAGMTTESNGRLLRSGGMIYINANAKGMQVELVKPIKVSISNQYYDSSMQVFKGIKTDSGSVNWIDPVQISDTTPQAVQWKNGKELFRAYCNNCHKLFEDGTGPAMAGIENRGPWWNRKNIYAFTRNPAKFMAGDRYTQDLKARFGSMMTAFPHLSDSDFDAMLDYIKNEEKRPNAAQEEKFYFDSLQKARLPADYPAKDQQDFDVMSSDSTWLINNTRPCKSDTIYVSVPTSQQTFFDNKADSKTSDAMDISDPAEPLKADALEGLRNGFNDPNPTSGMYDFEIKTFGWYNIDAFAEGYVGTTNVKLWARLQVDFDITVHLYLFMPRDKMLSVSNRKEGNTYSFDKLNGSIPLFLNDPAVLFAFGSKGDKLFYGISEFIIQGDQTIQIRIKETTPDEIRNMLLAKQMQGIDLGIEKKEMKVINRPCNEWLSPVDTNSTPK